SWALLLDKLSQLTIDYLVAQIKAGASAVQIFDSWVGLLGRFEFEKSVYPYVRDIIAQVKAQTGAPVCYFSTASLHLFPSFKELGADVIGVDWRVSLPQALSALESNVALQGNLDPIYLTGEGKGLEEAVRRVLQEGARIGPHIFNVGHGLGPETNPDLVQRTIELVR
ncbi:MAG: hypothetical protein KDD53_00270, partial [Bdellovibrionales bacterium]|nr:hypothetical protein [Bdellovibrionales bacterium]